MGTHVSRGLSLLVVAVYVVFAAVDGGGLGAAKVAAAVLLPLACIWFPEALGGFGGSMRLHPITSSTPAFLVAAGGWLLLVGLPVMAFFIIRAADRAF